MLLWSAVCTHSRQTDKDDTSGVQPQLSHCLADFMLPTPVPLLPPPPPPPLPPPPSLLAV